MGVLNPYVLLVVAVLWAGSCGVAYIKGKTHAENAAKAAYADALDDALANARETAKIDVRMAVEAESKRQKARVEFRDKIVTVERLINEKPLPAICRLSDDTLRLFNGIIRDANGAASDAKPPTVPAPTPTPRRDGSGVSAWLSGDY